MDSLVPARVPLCVRSLWYTSVVVIVLSFAIRLAMLGDHSYWGDELFSVRESAGGLENLTQYGATEVHTPTFAILLYVWIKLGRFLGMTGTSDAWTHLLTLGFVAFGVVGAWAGLRRTGVSVPGMWAGLVAVSTSGFALTYSLETRSYSLLLAGSLASTAYALLVAVQIRTGQAVPWWTWTAWALVASTAHLFGALLVLVQGLVIALVAVGNHHWAVAWPLARSIAIAIVPQMIWILYGVASTPGFAGNTNWISAPTASSVWYMLTTIFSSGGLVAYADGYRWSSPVGLGVLLAVVAAALLFRLAGLIRRGGSVPEPVPDSTKADTGRNPLVESDPDAQANRDSEASGGEDGFASIYLGVVSVVMITAVFLGSQIVHVWILRNMLTIFPAVVWTAVFGIMWLTKSSWAKAAVAWLILGTCVVAAAASLTTMRHPYKQDYRGFAEYVLQAHESNPEVQVRSKQGPEYLSLAAQRPISQFEEIDQLGRKQNGVPGEIIVSRSAGGLPAETRRRARLLITDVGRDDCVVVPFVQLAVIRCGEQP